MSLLTAVGRSAVDNAGLGEPLLANMNGAVAVHNGAVAAVVGAKGNAGALPTLKKMEDAKEKYWVDIDQPAELESAPDLETGSHSRPLLLFRNKKVKRRILYPYRMLILARLIAVILFFIWRLNNKISNIIWLWAISVAGDVWFGFSWLINQLPKVNPIKSIPDLGALKQKCDLGDGSSSLPAIDVFVTTANPNDEPILYTMNCILSILAVDYPVDKNACYLSDDAGALVQYEALVETAKFATLWVPFCRKYCIEPRAPESYFELKGQSYVGSSPEDFIIDHKYVDMEYEKFKMRIEMLPNTIGERSHAYNTMHRNATLMADGTQWPGTWLDTTENHKKGHHAPIFQIVVNQPSHTPQLGLPVGTNYNLDFSSTDVRLPMLVYVSREKHPNYDHQKKAGATNMLLRVSALLTNSPFIINFDCDHYINNSQSFRAAVCFMLDPREGENTAFVQFPQRFDNVDPTDRYCNHNRVFFDGTMLALNGLQGPTYLGTGCMFRRIVLYGIDSPRRRVDGLTARANNFGNSASFLNSMLSPGQEQKMPIKLNDMVILELGDVMTCAYEVCTGWGKDVGWIYNIATEDIATGFRAHRQGWCSKFCTIKPDAFRGTAPINLTERLLQIMRWSGGSLELFFSHNNPLLARGGLHPMQRMAYLNMTIYPITSIFIVLPLAYPFALAMLGKRGKRPITLFIVLPLAFVVVGVSYSAIHYFLLYFTGWGF